MRVGFPGGPRLEWYDRNPQPQEKQSDLIGEGPHSTTTRITYTVPTGKKMFVESAVARIERATAAGTALIASAQIFVRAFSICTARTRTNNVGDKAAMNVGRNCILNAGESISGVTADLSTGGTVDYLVAFHGIEFDA